MILLPPEPPITILTSPFLSVNIVGTIAERGLEPGLGAFSSDHVNFRQGEESVCASPISLLYTIPVFFEENSAPNLETLNKKVDVCYIHKSFSLGTISMRVYRDPCKIEEAIPLTGGKANLHCQGNK